jgi:hypothetical protein
VLLTAASAAVACGRGAAPAAPAPRPTLPPGVDAPVVAPAPGTAGPALSPADAQVLARVRAEGLGRSRVVETATILSDVFGPRLAGSQAYADAAEWARRTLAGYGLTARLEPWGVRRGNRWTLEGHSLELTAPYYARLVAYPFAWSPATGGAAGGAVRGTPVLVTEALRSAGDVARVADRVRGRIVLLGEVPALADAERLAARGRRWADAELDSLARLTAPGSPRTTGTTPAATRRTWPAGRRRTWRSRGRGRWRC